MIRIALGQLRSHLGRYLATIAAIVVSVAFVLSSMGVLRTMDASVDSVFGLRYADTAVLVTKVGDRTSASTQKQRDEVADTGRRAVDILRGVPGVRAVTVDSQTYVRVKPRDSAQRLTTATALSTDAGLRWQPLASGRLPGAPGEIAVRADGGFPLGTPLEVQPAGSDEVSTATVVGLLDLSDQPDPKSSFPIYTVNEQVQAWATGGAGGDIRVAGDGFVSSDALATSVKAALAPLPGSDGFGVTTGSAEAATLTESYLGRREAFSGVMYGFVLLAVAVAALVIATTFAVVFAARVRETALLRCLGAARWQLRLSGLVETVIVAAVATALGLALGRAAIPFISRHAGALGVTVPLGTVTIPTDAVLLSAVIGLGVTLLTALVPLWRATSGSPLAALHPTEVRADPWWRRVLLAVVGAAIAALCWTRLVSAVDTRSTIHAGAWGVGAFLGVLVLVSAVLPTLLGLVGTIVGSVLGPVGVLGARNTARSPRRTASVAAAVLIGVTLVSTMVTGVTLLKPTIENRFVDKVPLDVAVTATQGIVPAGLGERLAGVDGVSASLVVTDMYAKDASERQTVLRVADPATVSALMRRPVTVPGPGEIVLPSSSPVAAGARDGDRLPFTFFGDDRRELTVRRTTDQWALARPEDVPAWPAPSTPWGGPWPEGAEVPTKFVPRAEVWLRMDDGLTGPALEAALDRVRNESVSADPTLAVTEAFQSREQVRSTVRTVLTASSLLLAVTVAIAILGVINTLSLAVTERRREIALLRGVGVTRGGVRLLILFETLLVAASAAALGVLIGAAAGRYGAGSVVGIELISNISTPSRNLVGVGLAGTAAALVAGGVASVGAARGRPEEI